MEFKVTLRDYLMIVGEVIVGFVLGLTIKITETDQVKLKHNDQLILDLEKKTSEFNPLVSLAYGDPPLLVLSRMIPPTLVKETVVTEVESIISEEIFPLEDEIEIVLDPEEIDWDHVYVWDYDNFDLRTRVNVPENYLQIGLNWWGGDDVNKLMEESSVLLQCAEEYGINVYFICAVCALESGWGNSDLALYSNNYFGMQTTDGDSFVVYDSFESSVRAFCKLIRDEYLSENGRYFEGYTVDAINFHYNGRDEWAEEVIGLMQTINYAVCCCYENQNFHENHEVINSD